MRNSEAHLCSGLVRRQTDRPTELAVVTVPHSLSLSLSFLPPSGVAQSGQAKFDPFRHGPVTLPRSLHEGKGKRGNGERAHSRLSSEGGGRGPPSESWWCERDIPLAPPIVVLTRKGHTAFARDSLFFPSLPLFSPKLGRRSVKEKATDGRTALNATTNGMAASSSKVLCPLGRHLYFACVLNHPCHWASPSLRLAPGIYKPSASFLDRVNPRFILCRSNW